MMVQNNCIIQLLKNEIDRYGQSIDGSAFLPYKNPAFRRRKGVCPFNDDKKLFVGEYDLPGGLDLRQSGDYVILYLFYYIVK
jgi:hypothetical protein